MLTIFTTAKAFRGHINVIQRNALESWKRLQAGGAVPTAPVEVILFGDDEGAAEAARELGVRHVPQVERNEHSTKYLRSLFGQAQEIARHAIVAYVNCDIVLTGDFLRAVETVSGHFGAQGKFLMVGRRWDTDITAPLDFAAKDWAQRVRSLAFERNRQQSQDWIDYFVFPRGLYSEIPELVVGRIGWDNWLVWKARAEGAAVVDTSACVLAVHQNHDYAYHPQGKEGVWHGAEAARNCSLAGGYAHLYTIEDATHRLTAKGIEANRGYRLAPARRVLRRGRAAVWHALLGATRPVRHALGMRQSNVSSFFIRMRGKDL